MDLHRLSKKEEEPNSWIEQKRIHSDEKERRERELLRAHKNSQENVFFVPS